MANQFETPFVPQQPLLKVEAGVQRPREPLNLSLNLSLIVFFVTLAVAGGAYFYQKQVNDQVVAKGQELANKEKTFDTAKIGTYKNLQALLSTAKGLVDSHTIFSQIFLLLEMRTAENIGLTNLSFTQDDKQAVLQLAGQAPSYEAAYYQIQKWRESKPMIQEVQVSGVSLEETSGIVSFSVSMKLDPSTFSYATVLQASKNATTKSGATASTSPSQPLPPKYTAATSSTIIKTKSASTTPPI